MLQLIHQLLQVLDPLANRGKHTKPFKKTLRSDLSGGPLM